MLKINQLSKSFGKNSVLSDLSMTFEDKGVYVIVGTNGCGKTTFMNTLSHLSKADKGTVTCFDYPLGSKEYKNAIFYIPSDFYLPEYLTADEYLRFVLTYYPKASFDKVDILLSLLDLEPYRYQLLESYSFGMKKKIQLVAAIASNANYILADELFGGLDFDTVLLVQELLARLKKDRCFIIVSHDLNTLLAFPEKIYMMFDGNLLAFTDNPKTLANHVRTTGELNDKLQILHQYFNLATLLL